LGNDDAMNKWIRAIVLFANCEVKTLEEEPEEPKKEEEEPAAEPETAEPAPIVESPE